MEKNRCEWCKGFEQYVQYHDEEWGVPVHDDNTLFEFLILEGAQAGLSWATILKKREGYRQAFANFDPNIVAEYSEEKILELLQFDGIVKNKLKVRGTVTNAKAFLEVQKEFGSFAKYIWGFVNHEPIINSFKTLEEVPASTSVSDAMSKDLKKRGFKICRNNHYVCIYASLWIGQ